MCEPRGRTFRDLLRDEGYYNKWHAQVMSDILLPIVQTENCPNQNDDLATTKETREGTLCLYLVREVFRNLGLTSTEKIFEEEAGLPGTEQRFQDSLRSEFGAFALSTKSHLEPPVLLQLLYLILRSQRSPTRVCFPEEEVQVQWGIPQGLNESMMDRCMDGSGQMMHEDSVGAQSCDLEDPCGGASQVWNEEEEWSQVQDCGRHE